MEPRWRLNRRRWWSAKHCWPSIMDASNSSGWRTHKSSSGELTSSSSCTVAVSWLGGYLRFPLLFSSSDSSRPDRRCFRVMAGRIFSLTSHTVDNKTSELFSGNKKWEKKKSLDLDWSVVTHDTHYYNSRWYLIQRHSAHSGSLFSISLVYYFSDWNVLMFLIWWTFFYFFRADSFLTWEVHTKHKAVKCLNIVPKFSNGLCVCVCVWPGWKVRHEFWRLYLAKAFLLLLFSSFSLSSLSSPVLYCMCCYGNV